jgi:hypothetical protein
LELGETAPARPSTTADKIEKIDIGGPSMLRSAAKNHAYVTVIVDPADYARCLEEMSAHGGANTLASVVNSGAFNVTSGSTQVKGTFSQISGTTRLSSAGGPSATLEAGEGFAFNGGRLEGTGTLVGNVNVNNAVVAPGFSPGAINVEGNLTLGSGSTLEIQIAIRRSTFHLKSLKRNNKN